MYPVEKIPDTDKLYRRVHKTFVINGELIPIAFRENDGGMSTDWEKYSTPEQARLRAKKNPGLNGIVSLVAGELRNIDLKVVHSPTHNHQSHADVIGVDTESRLLLLEIYTWEIRV